MQPLIEVGRDRQPKTAGVSQAVENFGDVRKQPPMGRIGEMLVQLGETGLAILNVVQHTLNNPAPAFRFQNFAGQVITGFGRQTRGVAGGEGRAKPQANSVGRQG